MADRYVLDSDGQGTHCADCNERVCVCDKPDGGALLRKHYALDSDGQGSTCNDCKKSLFVCTCAHGTTTRNALVDELGRSPTR